MPTVSEDNNEDSGDESVEMSNKEYTKTPRKIQRTTTPAPPKFAPKKKTVYRSEDSSSDKEGDDNTSNTSDDDTADSGGGGDKPDSSDNNDSDPEEEEQNTNPGEAWAYFIALCNLNEENIAALNGMGYHTTNDIELFGGSESNETIRYHL